MVLRGHAAAWRQVGHAGTLDPLATGLLIICVGKATKQINTYVAAEKEYTGAARPHAALAPSQRRHASLSLCIPRLASPVRKARFVHYKLAGMHRAVDVTPPSPGRQASARARAGSCRRLTDGLRPTCLLAVQ